MIKKDQQFRARTVWAKSLFFFSFLSDEHACEIEEYCVALVLFYRKNVEYDCSRWDRDRWKNGAEISTFVYFNSFAPVKCGCNFESLIFKLVIQNSSLGTRCETALKLMSQNLINEKSTLVQVMAWWRQAASHYLSQCWPRSISPHIVTRPQWVN